MTKRSAGQQLARLSEEQRSAVKNLLSRYEKGDVLSLKDVGLLGVKHDSMSQDLTAKFFGKSVQTLREWVKDGCPRNSDGTYNSVTVIDWLQKRESEKNKKSDNLDNLKKEAELEYKKAQTERIKGEYIRRTEHESLLCSMANSLRNFLENSRPMNDHLFVGLSMDQARLRRRAEEIQMMDAFTGGMGEWIQE